MIKVFIKGNEEKKEVYGALSIAICIISKGDHQYFLSCFFKGGGENNREH